MILDLIHSIKTNNFPHTNRAKLTVQANHLTQPNLANRTNLTNQTKQPQKKVFIQTHDFPDHDAIASSYALQYLLQEHNIESTIVYAGDIQRDSLRRMITQYQIAVQLYHQANIAATDWIIIVDGCKGSRNVTDLAGVEIAVIDHHEKSSQESVVFSDIRPEIGACSSMLYGYFEELQLAIPEKIASPLLIGLNVDTNSMTRGVHERDLVAFSGLFHRADLNFVHGNLRNYLKINDLRYYRQAIENLKIFGPFAFCYFPHGCEQNLLGMLGDFFLALEEIDFVVLCAQNHGVINLSVRNESEHWNAALVIRDVLQGIGFGGGHLEMAGGIIKDVSHFIEKNLIDNFLHTLNIDKLRPNNAHTFDYAI